MCVFVYNTLLPPSCVLSPPWNSVLAAGWMKNKAPKDLVCWCVSMHPRAHACVSACACVCVCEADIKAQEQIPKSQRCSQW